MCVSSSMLYCSPEEAIINMEMPPSYRWRFAFVPSTFSHCLPEATLRKSRCPIAAGHRINILTHSLRRSTFSTSNPSNAHSVNRFPFFAPVCASAVGSPPPSQQSPVPDPSQEIPELQSEGTQPSVPATVSPLPAPTSLPSSNSKLNQVSSSEINRNIAKIALPALGTLALDPLVALADMACVGHLGATALGGVGIGNNVFNIFFTCFNFLGLATTPAIARAYARNDTAEASRLIAQALWVAVISGSTAFLILSVFTRPILTFFGANSLILPHAMAYLRARIIAAPFCLSAMVGNGTFRGFQDTRTPLFVGLFANSLNLVLYPSLIFVFKLGTRGAGMAMATGQIAAGTTLLALMIVTKKLRLRDLSKLPRPTEIFPLLRAGGVLSVRTLSIFSTISYATATAAKLGTVEVAAFEIGRQIFALFAKLLDAISVAAQALVALALGKDDHVLARTTASRILRLGFTMGCGFVALLMLLVNVAPVIFTVNPAVRSMVSLTFPFMAAVQPINGLVFVFDGIYTAGRKFSLLSSSIFVAACFASSFLFFARKMSLPLQYVWIGLNIMMVLRASILGFFYLTKWSPVPHKKKVAVVGTNDNGSNV